MTFATALTLLGVPENCLVHPVDPGVRPQSVVGHLVDSGPDPSQPRSVVAGAVANDGKDPRLVEGDPVLDLNPTKVNARQGGN